MKVNTKYTKEQLDWLKKHSLDDKYLNFLYPKKKVKKVSKKKPFKKDLVVKDNVKSIPYSEQLKHPLWLKKREYILNKKGRRCSNCGSSHNLQVHHLRYIWGKMAWEYKDKDLIVLCDSCHERIHCIDLDKEFKAITT